MEATTDWATRLKTSSLISGETGDSLSKPGNTKREEKEPEQARELPVGVSVPHFLLSLRDTYYGITENSLEMIS